MIEDSYSEIWYSGASSPDSRKKNLILNRGLIDYHDEPWYSKMFSASSSKTVVIGGVDFNGSVSGGFLILEGLRARSRFALIKFHEIE